jgi:hypothetical protein
VPRFTVRRLTVQWTGAVMAVLLAGPRPLSAQATYAAANADASIVPLHYGFVSADFAEAKFGLTFTERLGPLCEDGRCLGNQLNFSLYVSAAARKRQQTLFAKLDFEPGFDAGGRVVYVFQRDGPGYDAVYLGGRYTAQRRNIIDVNTTTGINTLGEDQQRTFAASVGFNHAFSEATIVGVGFEGRRELSTPGVQLATEWCTPGSAPNGYRVVVCRDRFLAPLTDLWTGQARLDLTVRLTDFGETEHAASLALATAASVDVIEGVNKIANFAAGPAVHVAGYPGHTVAVLLFGLRDAFDANGIFRNDGEDKSYLTDHFLVRLVLGMPFPVVVGN